MFIFAFFFYFFFFIFLSVYQLFVSTGFSGIDDDKVSIILVGVGGAQTSVHHLSGPFDRYRQVWQHVKWTYDTHAHVVMGRFGQPFYGEIHNVIIDHFFRAY